MSFVGLGLALGIYWLVTHRAELKARFLDGPSSAATTEAGTRPRTIAEIEREAREGRHRAPVNASAQGAQAPTTLSVTDPAAFVREVTNRIRGSTDQAQQTVQQGVESANH